jgi:hypothetical protein
VKSVIDVGCGEGHALKWFRDQGCTVLGIDGVDQDDPDIMRHDYTTGPLHNGAKQELWKYVEPYGNPPQLPQADLVWCCEFVEHVEERFVPNFLSTFELSDLVLMTHAEPGQQGHHHVNTQTPMYWQGVMAAIGYELDPGLTDMTRGLAAMNSNPYNHFARSGLAFVKYRKWADDYRGFGSNVAPKKQR